MTTSYAIKNAEGRYLAFAVPDGPHYFTADLLDEAELFPSMTEAAMCAIERDVNEFAIVPVSDAQLQELSDERDTDADGRTRYDANPNLDPGVPKQ